MKSLQTVHGGFFLYLQWIESRWNMDSFFTTGFSVIYWGDLCVSWDQPALGLGFGKLVFRRQGTAAPEKRLTRGRTRASLGSPSTPALPTALRCALSVKEACCWSNSVQKPDSPPSYTLGGAKDLDAGITTGQSQLTLHSLLLSSRCHSEDVCRTC